MVTELPFIDSRSDLQSCFHSHFPSFVNTSAQEITLNRTNSLVCVLTLSYNLSCGLITSLAWFHYNMADKRFDLIIFGVTGYTGVYCLRNLLQIEKNEQKKYSFAVAGRSKEKIKSVLDRVGKEVDRNLVEEIEIIEANVADRKSLIEMTKKCRVLINVVGPYAQFGRPVVEACIEASAKYFD